MSRRQRPLHLVCRSENTHPSHPAGKRPPRVSFSLSIPVPNLLTLSSCCRRVTHSMNHPKSIPNGLTKTVSVDNASKCALKISCDPSKTGNPYLIEHLIYNLPVHKCIRVKDQLNVSSYRITRTSKDVSEGCSHSAQRRQPCTPYTVRKQQDVGGWVQTCLPPFTASVAAPRCCCITHTNANAHPHKHVADSQHGNSCNENTFYM